LQDFADTPLLADSLPTLEAFDGNIEVRVQFYDSKLYRNFLELRCQALLRAAQVAEKAADREKLLGSLAGSSGSVEGEATEFQRQVLWARTLFAYSLPAAARLAYALEKDAPQRTAFAATFRTLEEDPPWVALRTFAGVAEVPAETSWKDFQRAMECFSGDASLRKRVQNPLAAAVLDFRSELAAHAAAPWFLDLLECAAGHKLSAWHWPGVSGAWSLAAVAEDQWQPVAKAVAKLWLLKGPQWAAAVREKANERKEQARQVAAAAAKASETAAATAPGNGAAAEAPAADEAVNVATAAAEAPAPDATGGAAAAAPATPAAETPAAPTPSAEAASKLFKDTVKFLTKKKAAAKAANKNKISVGDYGVLLESAGKQWKDSEVEVTKVEKNKIQVRCIFTGKIRGIKPAQIQIKADGPITEALAASGAGPSGGGGSSATNRDEADAEAALAAAMMDDE